MQTGRILIDYSRHDTRDLVRGTACSTPVRFEMNK